jgi:hypothetical protein
VAAQIAAAGFKFVGRYLVPKRYAKRITAQEAQILTDAGLLILSIFEATSNRAAGGEPYGIEDGETAFACAVELKMPKSAAICFAVDFDMKSYDVLEAYLRAAKKKIGAHPVGVYGSYYVVEEMARRGVCDFYMQCIAWSSGNVSSRANVYQYAWDETLAGIGVDLNYLYNGTGLWNYKEDNMTGEDIYNALTDYLREQPCPPWAQAELQEAIKMGITDGTRPCELMPRYQAAIMAKRAAEEARK